jgi:hypothetical protein
LERRNDDHRSADRTSKDKGVLPGVLKKCNQDQGDPLILVALNGTLPDEGRILV